MKASEEGGTLKLEKVEYAKVVTFGTICLILAAIGFKYFRFLLFNGGIQIRIFIALASVFLITGVCSALWMILGSTYLIVENGCLYVKYTLLSISLKKKFLVERISDLELGDNADSSFFWGFAGIRIYRKVSCLSFYYNDQEKQFKGSLSGNDFQLLKQWIKK
ncbi:MAG: hypothetical protein JST19_22175 [Bacteroidetes bacterium]|nr:hypothetical protein [Bacteroidota bacterium]